MDLNLECDQRTQHKIKQRVSRLVHNTELDTDYYLTQKDGICYYPG